MSYLNALEVLKEHLVMPEDLTECKWFHDTQSNSVSWTSEEDIDMLYDGAGETFSEASLEGVVEIDGYVLFTLSDSCGGSGQVIFLASNKVECPYE
jgi:hypothetical protein